jgi:hypothetical protein
MATRSLLAGHTFRWLSSLLASHVWFLSSGHCIRLLFDAFSPESPAGCVLQLDGWCSVQNTPTCIGKRQKRFLRGIQNLHMVGPCSICCCSATTYSSSPSPSASCSCGRNICSKSAWANAQAHNEELAAPSL